MKRWNELASSISGFIAAGIFDRHGTLLSGLSKDADFHIEHAAATYVTLINEADRAGNFAGLGESAEVQLIYKNAIILLRAIDGSEGRLVLGLASKNDAPLGRIRVGMDLIVRKIVEPSKARLSRARAKTQEVVRAKIQEPDNASSGESHENALASSTMKTAGSKRVDTEELVRANTPSFVAVEKSDRSSSRSSSRSSGSFRAMS